MTILVSVIIVNYNGQAYLKKCLDSLLSLRRDDIKIIVCDNASSDGSQRLLEEEFKGRVSIICSKENLGFGGANNLAAKRAKGKYLLFLKN